MRTQYNKLLQEQVDAEARLAEIVAARTARRSVDEEVAAAIQVLDDLQRVTKDDDARGEIQPLLVDLGVNVGLNFVEATKGKKRKVRKLASGVIAFGNELIDRDPGRGVVCHGRKDSKVDR